jgi:hypothetical protein
MDHAPSMLRRLSKAISDAYEFGVTVLGVVAAPLGVIVVVAGITFVMLVIGAGTNLPSAWTQVREWTQSALAYIRNEPPSVEECLRAAAAWRKYGQTMLSERRARACDDAYGTQIR